MLQFCDKRYLTLNPKTVGSVTYNQLLLILNRLINYM